MITLLLHLFRVLPFLFGRHRQLALENLALQQQLAVYKRTVIRPPAGDGSDPGPRRWRPPGTNGSTSQASSQATS
jgi:hypothetical protein